MPFSFNPFKPFTKSSARRRVTQLAGQDAEATPDQAAAQRVVRKDTEEASFESLFSKAQHLLLQARSEAAQVVPQAACLFFPAMHALASNPSAAGTKADGA